MTNTRIGTRSPLRSLSAVGFTLAAALLGVVGTASTAHADNADQAFISTLRAHGIEHESEQTEIQAGHLVCHQLGMGKTPQQVATDIMNSSTLDGDNAGFFVGIAEEAYCPQYSNEN
ncbi:MAG: DUF732 domain-containing protein [Mycobacterium sp.]